MSIAQPNGLDVWNDPNAPEHIRKRQVVMQLQPPLDLVDGVRTAFPRRRPADEVTPCLRGYDFGLTIMTHHGASNGRLSTLLSTIPENYPVTVASDGIGDEASADSRVAAAHGARFSHLKEWGGRAANAIHAMQAQTHRVVLFLNDDVWLSPECVLSALRWFHVLREAGLPLASLACPGWETVSLHADPNWAKWSYSSWQQCLDEPHRFNAIPPNPAFNLGPRLWKNPFGACFVINREAYDDLGGFTPHYWAEDDVWNHQVWTSERWVSAGYPGRGYMHLGAQSWHHGESQESVGDFKRATGLTPDDSGAAQVRAMEVWQARLQPILERLGGC